ncbi:MAG: HDOD domain-containing protein [Aliarcobacter sp.]|nr:HDOD domain-containing protein [Aliarcobacter sp.]
MKKDLIAEINSLPALPSSVIELEKYKVAQNTNINNLISIIEQDPLMIVTILKIANSSMFGFRSKIETLSRAINLLGINFTISIAIGSAIQNTINSNLLAYAVKNEDFIFTSALASNIINTWVSTINFDLKNELLLPAFLQEVGKFIISEVIQKNRKTEEFLIDLEDTKDITFCEKKHTGYSCARITANVFKQWNISPNIIIPIAFTDDIESCPNEFKIKAQILEIVKILCDIRYPLSDENIHKALEKVALYNFDVEDFLNSIDVIKEVIKQNT